MGAGLFSMTESRMKAVTFSHSFGVEQLTILMRSPSGSKSKNILEPFSPLVWLLIVTSSVAMMLTMYVMISLLEHRLLTHHDRPGDHFTLSQLSWFIWSALVKQGSILSPSADVSR